MATWDPGGILEPNVEIDVIKPQYKLGGQTIQWGEAFGGYRTIPDIDPLYMLAFTAVNPGFDILQWFIDTYGIANIPDSNRILYFNDSGPCNYVDSTFAIAIEWNAGKCCFTAGFTNGGSLMDSYIIGSWTAYSSLSVRYSYTGCDLSNITEKDHQLATCYFFKHTDLSPDATAPYPDYTFTALSSKSYMIYNMIDKAGNSAPLTGPNVNLPTNYEGYGWAQGQISSQIYQGYPLSAMFGWTEKNPPAFMYELIDNYTKDTAQTGGGLGDYGFYSDSVGFAELPTVGFTDTGFGGLYAPTKLELQNLADFLWSDAFLDNIKCNKDNAMNCIINLGLLPLELASVRGTSEIVKAGNVGTGVSLTKLTEQYLAVDMGTIDLMERWESSLDYEPLTVIECYLPFLGFVQIPTSEIMGSKTSSGKISLQYNVNLLTGDFVAQIRSNNRGADNVIAQHTGNMMYSLPFSADNYTNFYKNILGGAVQMVSNLATGNIAGAVTSAAATAVNSLAPSTVQRSGTIAGGSAIMGGFTPYLLIRQPVQHLDAEGYAKLEGFPSYVYRQLSTVEGYVEVEKVKMDGFTGTQEEAAELEQLLKGGVYL